MTNYGAELKVNSPFDGKAVGSVQTLDARNMERALNRAHGIFSDPKKCLTVPERRKILEHTMNIILGKFETVVATAVKEGGKPLTDSRVEVNRGLRGIEIAIETIGHMPGYEVPMNQDPRSANRMAFVTREPVGLVAAISAFNHPFNLIVHQVIPAIAVGCPVIVKPAAATPLSCKMLVDALYEAGLPEDWCTFAPCNHDVAEQLVVDRRIRFLTFIGSARVGWQLKAKLPPGAGCALEHGGVAPVIIAEDADIGDTVPLLVKAGYYHAGQVCVSVQRVYVHDAVFSAFVDKFREQVEKLSVGNPLDEKTDVGPLIDIKEVDRVDEWVKEAIDAGATLVSGGKKVGDTCYAPTILVDPPEQVNVSTREVFGPVVCLYRYRNLDEVVHRANALPYCFQAAAFTKNIDTAFKCIKQLKARAVMVNDHTAFRVDWMPFGGNEESGYGTGGIPYTMHDMTYEKLLVFRSSELR